MISLTYSVAPFCLRRIRISLPICCHFGTFSNIGNGFSMLSSSETGRRFNVDRRIRCLNLVRSKPIIYHKRSYCYNDGSKLTNSKKNGKPTWEQLQHITLRLSDTLPRFMQIPLDYTFYREDVIFVNNILNDTTIGLEVYRWRLSMISVYFRIRYPIVEFQVLNVTPMIEEGTVRVRWRILYKTWLDLIIAVVFQFKISYRELRKDTRWFDAYSIFHVCSDGLVYKHIVDRVMPDDHKPTVNRPKSFLTRLLGTVGAKSAVARVNRKRFFG